MGMKSTKGIFDELELDIGGVLLENGLVDDLLHYQDLSNAPTKSVTLAEDVKAYTFCCLPNTIPSNSARYVCSRVASAISTFPSPSVSADASCSSERWISSAGCICISVTTV